MKIFLIIASFAIGMKANAQITLEHDYDSAATVNFCFGNFSQLMIINFEVSGEKYVKVNRCSKVIEIYNLNHSIHKTISLSGVPPDYSGVIRDVLYISETLFDTDPAIEFMYSTTWGDYYITNIYKEDGTLIFSDTGSVNVYPNYEMQQYPIYNTSQGTKMILSYKNGHAKVFGLPGLLSSAINEVNINLTSTYSISNPYPNPSVNSTQIDYNLPTGINQGEIVIYDLQGKEIKRYKVDRTFNTLQITTSDLAAGTYYYQLQASGHNSAGKKMVVIK